MLTESQGELLTRCRRMVNSEVYCDVTELVNRVEKLEQFVKTSGIYDQYFAVSEWLYSKLCSSNQKVTCFSNLYIWARESTIDNVIYMDDVIQKIVNNIMIDYEKL